MIKRGFLSQRPEAGLPPAAGRESRALKRPGRISTNTRAPSDMMLIQTPILKELFRGRKGNHWKKRTEQIKATELKERSFP
jgi:hypothetical protein